MLELTTGRKVYKVFGKPNADVINSLITEESIPLEDIIMVGDRLYTDIKMANNASIDSILVLSRDTSREDVEKDPLAATYVLKDTSRIFSF